MEYQAKACHALVTGLALPFPAGGRQTSWGGQGRPRVGAGRAPRGRVPARSKPHPCASPQFLLYCEGTRFTEKKHRVSMEVAAAKGLPVLKYHLLPRTKGFTTAVQCLRGTGEGPATTEPGRRRPRLRVQRDTGAVRSRVHDLHVKQRAGRAPE